MPRWLHWPSPGVLAGREPHEPGLHAFHTAAAQAWLQRLCLRLAPGYRIDEGQRALLLSPENLGDARLLLKIADDTLRRVPEVLQRLARQPALGKLPIVLMASEEEYLHYVSRLHPDGGEYGVSGGMFTEAGRPHIVTAAHRFDLFERVLAHEVAHLCLRTLRLPLWLDEGIAVHAEEQLLGPAPSLYRPKQLQAMHARYWTAERMQALWQGRIFHAPDDGQLLGYDLARQIVALMSRPDFDTFARFAERARRDDAGAAAARAVLGTPLQHYVAAIVGEGDWRPQPALPARLLASPDAP